MANISKETFERCRNRAIPTANLVEDKIYLLFMDYPDMEPPCMCYSRRFKLDYGLHEYLDSWYYLRTV